MSYAMIRPLVMASDPADIELIEPLSNDEGKQAPSTVASKRVDRRLLAIFAAVALGILGLLVVTDDAGDGQADNQSINEAASDPVANPTTTPPSDRLDAIQSANAIPKPLLAAELFAASPSAEGLRDLLDAVGGFEALTVGSAEGAFDLVRFDPTDPTRLLASQRLSYGDAQNQSVNETWQVTPSGQVEQRIWEPSISHDFVHYNIDGTVTMWVHGGGSGFAPRVAVAADSDADFSATSETATRSEPMYASRFTSVGGTVFALTGNGDYYTNEPAFVDLIADDGSGTQVLDDGSLYGWVDNPTAEIMVAYPADQDGLLTVWDTETLELLPGHPLARRSYRRAGISGDQTVAIGATFDGELEIVDLVTGLSRGTFGDVEVAGVDQPITMNADGTIALIVENTGRVSMWWIGDQTPIASVFAHDAQPRWVSAEYAPRSTSVVSADTTRIALLTSATAETPTTWEIVDTDPRSWIERACNLVSRQLTVKEVEALGLVDQPQACAD